MSDRLRAVYERVLTLSDEEQDLIAARWMDDLEDDAKWEARFATSHDELRRMAEEAIAEDRADRTRFLAEIVEETDAIQDDGEVPK